MRKATKITPANLNFYDEIFNWKKPQGQKMMITAEGIVKVPRIHKVGNLSSALRNIKSPTSKGEFAIQKYIDGDKNTTSNENISKIKNFDINDDFDDLDLGDGG